MPKERNDDNDSISMKTKNKFDKIDKICDDYLKSLNRKYDRFKRLLKNNR